MTYRRSEGFYALPPSIPPALKGMLENYIVLLIELLVGQKWREVQAAPSLPLMSAFFQTKEIRPHICNDSLQAFHPFMVSVML
jgi:hypothetical protein